MTDDPRKLWKDGKTLGEIAQNADGTWNGLKAMSAISGLAPGEVQWIFDRTRQLKAEGLSVPEIKERLRVENPFAREALGAKQP